MNRLLISVLLWVGLLGSAFGQSISSSPGSAAGVIGPSGAPAPGTVTDNAIVRWDGTTGTLVQDSRAILTDTGSLRLGGADAAAPATILLDFQGVVAGTANTAGPNVTIAAPVSTGSAAGGSIIFQTAAAGGAGSGQNALATALTLAPTGIATFSTQNSSTTPVITFSGDTGTGISHPGSNSMRFIGNQTQLMGIDNSGTRVVLPPTGTYSWTSASDLGTASDLFLYRDAANTLALRNSTTAQAFNLYKTYIDASNYEVLKSTVIGSTFYIYTAALGTGTARGLSFQGGGGAQIDLANATASIVLQPVGGGNIDAQGPLRFVADNTYDIGASGATRPRNVYVGTNITAGQNVISAGVQITNTSYYGWTTQSQISSPSDGIVLLQNFAGSAFTRLQFGGTTSSFPAIARNGIKLEAKLADDSTYASFATRGVIVAGAVPTLTLAGGTCAGTVIAGGSTAGTVTLTGVCVATNTMALTVMPTAPTGYACDAIDRTLGSSLLTETATTTTSVTFTFGGTTGATDVLAYKCLAY